MVHNRSLTQHSRNYFTAEWLQGGPKMASRRPQSARRLPPEGPAWPREGTEKAIEGLKMAALKRTDYIHNPRRGSTAWELCSGHLGPFWPLLGLSSAILAANLPFKIVSWHFRRQSLSSSAVSCKICFALDLPKILYPTRCLHVSLLTICATCYSQLRPTEPQQPTPRTPSDTPKSDSKNLRIVQDCTKMAPETCGTHRVNPREPIPGHPS